MEVHDKKTGEGCAKTEGSQAAENRPKEKKTTSLEMESKEKGRLDKLSGQDWRRNDGFAMEMVVDIGKDREAIRKV